MSNRSDTWSTAEQAAFSHVQDLFVEERYQDSLIAASNLLARAGETAQTGVHRVLLEIIRQCADDLLSQAVDRKVDPSCSFCGRAPPAVRLGAGHSSFICNECVDVFSNVLNPPQSSDPR